MFLKMLNIFSHQRICTTYTKTSQYDPMSAFEFLTLSSHLCFIIFDPGLVCLNLSNSAIALHIYQSDIYLYTHCHDLLWQYMST